jgi:hypothetical protein
MEEDVLSMLRLPFSDRVTPRTMGPHDREFLATTGLMVTAGGALLGLDPSARAELFLGWFWPWWWCIAGAACVAYALRPTSVNLHAFSGAALTLSAVSRAVQLGMAVALGDVPDGRMLRTTGGVLVFLLLGRLVRRQWLTLQPLPGGPRERT